MEMSDTSPLLIMVNEIHAWITLTMNALLDWEWANGTCQSDFQ